ncbi:MAG: hypothetical protein JWP89_1117 [Schlesneria sp.]|nr:hypothetical protein [Schlesneria sp.]
MAGFWGVVDFVSGMSRQNLSIEVLKMTHRSASHKKNGHTCWPFFCGQQVWPLVTVHRKSGFLPSALCHSSVRDARWPLSDFDTLSRKSRQPLAVLASPDAQTDVCRLTVFDTRGQFLTMGDKTGLFLAVFLKKVDVL